MHKKNKKLLIVLAIIALLSIAAVATVLVYDRVDHSGLIGKSEVSQYNTAITATARGYSSIATDEFVIIDTVSKELDGHTNITFRVYKLPEGDLVSKYASLKVGDLPADFAPDYVGNGKAQLVNGSLTKIIITVTYFK